MTAKKHKLAIIVPYRDRANHLAQFVPHMKAHLADQGIENTIYVIEQEAGKPFNRAKLLNIGFLEARADHDYFVFHDVDMLPNGIDYGYRDTPTHLAFAASQFSGGMPYPGYFGGATMFDKFSFESVNGFSNEYWGWGAEDDDILLRCKYSNLRIERPSHGTMTSLSHKRDTDAVSHSKNSSRLEKMRRGAVDWRSDGINSCNYSAVTHKAESNLRLIKAGI